MKNRFIISGLFAILLSFTACQKEDGNSKNTIQNMMKAIQCDEAPIKNVFMCNELILSENNQTPTRAALLRGKKWRTGQTIRVKFMNGSPYVQNKVKYYATIWLRYANLKFEYIEDITADADIKIAFKWDCDYTSWSYIGTDCKKIGKYRPSMNFGWFNDYTLEYEFRRVILHEFGHALGLVHEHQHPKSDIQWNREAVYEYYANVEGWNKETVESNILNKYKASQTNYSQFDKESIMLYPISSSLTLNGFNVGWNIDLSETDKKFIALMYPY